MRFLLFLLFLINLFDVTNAAECGLAMSRSHGPQRAKRSSIVGGQLSEYHSWPWQVALMKHVDDEIRWAGCGGTIIGSRWALTAAHCFLTRDSSIPIFANYSVLIGSTDAFGFFEPHEPDSVRAVKRIIRHPDYQWAWAQEDIALLELEDAPSTDSLMPVCLPSRAQSIPVNSTQAVATGYGADKVPTMGRSGITVDGQLREASLTVHSLQHCARHGPQFRRIYRDGAYLCAGDPSHNTFRGDSGGPLMMKSTDGRWFQIGISSGSSLKPVKPYNATAEYIKYERRMKRRLRIPRNVEGSGEVTEVEAEGSGETDEDIALELEGSGDDITADLINELRKTPSPQPSTISPMSSSSTEKAEMTESEEMREEQRTTKYILAHSAFTNVHKYCDWIEEVTEGEVRCPEEEVFFQSTEISSTEE